MGDTATLEAETDAGLVAMGEVPDDVWLDVASGARFVARHPASTRETVFLGPARVRACVDHAEESWLLRGGFDSVPGAGERPGGEEWVITPVASIRYAAVAMRVSVSDEETDVQVAKGTVYMWAAGDAAMRITSEAGSPLAADGGPSRENDEGWARVDGGFHVKIRAGRPTTGAAREGAANAALAQCRPAAKVAHDLADQIAAPDASLATLAPKHVSARREARAVCRVALLRIESLAPSATRDSDLAAARAAEQSWRSLSDTSTEGPQVSPMP